MKPSLGMVRVMAGLGASSIFRKQVLVAIVLVVATGTALAVLEQVQVQKLLRKQVAERLSVEAARREELIVTYVRNQLERVALVASRTRLRTLITERAALTISEDEFQRSSQRILEDALRSSSRYKAIWVADTQGMVITATDPQYLAQDISENDAFRRGAEDRYLGDVVLQEGRERAIVAAPARSSQGEPLAVVMVLVDAEPLARIVRQRTRLGESGEVMLAAPERGEIRSLVAPLHARSVLQLPFEEAPLPMQRALGGQTGFMETPDYRGVDTLAAYRPVGFQDWGLVAKIDAAEAYRPVTVFVRRLLLVDTAILAVGVLLVFFVVRRMTTPLKELTAAIEQFRKGNLAVRVPVRTQDEIGVLGESFNRMAEQIARSHETDARLAAIVESSADAIIGKTLDGIVTSWNRGAERLYGYTETEMIGRPISTLFPPDRREGELALMTRIRRGERIERHETVRIRKDGRPLQISLSVSPVRDAQGRIVGASAIAHDITDLKRMQMELQQRSRDLETLLYVTSHDLREPLRSIRNFSEMVDRRYAPKIDSKGQDFLHRVVRAADRMDELLEDVITVSRAQRTVEPNEDVDAERIVIDALDRLEESIKATGAAIHMHKPLPKVHVDRLWATQAIFNLVANALKFTRPEQPPEIEIGPYPSSPSDSPREVGLVVRDRGPGVPLDQCERIFELFQRGVGREVDGTGAGLAIVRQVAERHGGRAWVQPREGGGSEFVITFGS